MRRILTTAFVSLLSVALIATSAAGAACDLSCGLGAGRSGCGAAISAKPRPQTPNAMPAAGTSDMHMGQDLAMGDVAGVAPPHSMMSSCLCQPDGTNTAPTHLRISHARSAQVVGDGVDRPNLLAWRFVLIRPDASPPVETTASASAILRV